jgi:O-antigen/teichoic acid export membrane protein
MLSMYFSGHLARPQIATAVNWTLLPVQALLAWQAMVHFGILGVAVATSTMFLATMLVFLVLFLRAQDTVRLGGLLRLGAEDFAPWRRFFASVLGRRRR